ncbi:hypothetical protein PGTUg99_006585 [Puccinia graminis f. sp. tritici]|uniref:Uncharacterized protein n=1 Tax=Puccinia graminis f. sp. tritici TaxID=56615 RepID=A0A5B0SBM4_PUCGR|nr:hypothetical protein PGTUg99_006585 [Puccinia graminis f. sp. tritici]
MNFIFGFGEGNTLPKAIRGHKLLGTTGYTCANNIATREGGCHFTSSQRVVGQNPHKEYISYIFNPHGEQANSYDS